jgi:thiamine-phosphate pyrophosphorylase
LLLYYITDRSQFPGDENARQRALLQKVDEAVRCGVDLIQLREKDLPTRELEALARSALRIVHLRKAENRESKTCLLINSRTDIAIACGADGVHLRSNDIAPDEVQKIWAQTGNSPHAVVGVSCHSMPEVGRAASGGAGFAVFAPVFEKRGAVPFGPAGLDRLREACQQKVPVLALGGITINNARVCRDAGAAGIAAVRLFQENNIAEVVRHLRD